MQRWYISAWKIKREECLVGKIKTTLADAEMVYLGMANKKRGVFCEKNKNNTPWSQLADLDNDSEWTVLINH